MHDFQHCTYTLGVLIVAASLDSQELFTCLAMFGRCFCCCCNVLVKSVNFAWRKAHAAAPPSQCRCGALKICLWLSAVPMQFQNHQHDTDFGEWSLVRRLHLCTQLQRGTEGKEAKQHKRQHACILSRPVLRPVCGFSVHLRFVGLGFLVRLRLAWLCFVPCLI
jgi:hypothetical protein